MVKYLVEHGFDVNKVGITENYCGLIKQDFNKKNRSLKAQLFYAYKRGNEVMVKYLVEHGFDVNKVGITENY